MSYFVVVLAVAFFVAGTVLSLASREGAAAGLLSGHLSPCPGTPNCVCSEYPQNAGYVAPLPFVGDADAAWEKAKKALTGGGGEISRVENGYLAATFKTTLFRFVDDVELRLDRVAGVIHIRSASRVGRSDLGVNRKRVAAIRSRFNSLMGQK